MSCCGEKLSYPQGIYLDQLRAIEDERKLNQYLAEEQNRKYSSCRCNKLREKPEPEDEVHRYGVQVGDVWTVGTGSIYHNNIFIAAVFSRDGMCRDANGRMCSISKLKSLMYRQGKVNKL